MFNWLFYQNCLTQLTNCSNRFLFNCCWPVDFCLTGFLFNCSVQFVMFNFDSFNWHGRENFVLGERWSWGLCNWRWLIFMDTALILSDRPSKGDGCCLPGTLLVQFHEDYLDLSLNCNLPSNVMFSHNLFLSYWSYYDIPG